MDFAKIIATISVFSTHKGESKGKENTHNPRVIQEMLMKKIATVSLAREKLEETKIVKIYSQKISCSRLDKVLVY